MPEKHVFEYAVVRLVPRVEREEFLNVGVVLYCPAEKYLDIRCQVDEARITAFAPGIEVQEVKDRLAALGRICKGGKHGGPIGELPLSGRFRWLTANRSTIVQMSPVHPGLTVGAVATLEKLFGELVA